ncbi:MAG: hypothetical protein ACRCTE_12995 [Cellulosilyticaceae bacterium]
MKLLTPQLIYTLMFVIGITIIFLTLARKIKKGSSDTSTALQSFIKEDHEANFVTKKKLPEDLLLCIDLSQIPVSPLLGTESTYEKVQKLGTKPMACLSHYTNVELKKTFGINHLETLFAYEQHYQLFLQALTEYGILLHENDCIDESITTLEYSVKLGCDLNKCYLYLIKNYGIINDKQHLIALKKYLKEQPPLGKEMVEAALDAMLQSIKNQ